ncbi:hypothetical protein ACOMHN_044066 [Nucella lapillus]
MKLTKLKLKSEQKRVQLVLKLWQKKVQQDLKWSSLPTEQGFQQLRRESRLSSGAMIQIVLPDGSSNTRIKTPSYLLYRQDTKDTESRSAGSRKPSERRKQSLIDDYVVYKLDEVKPSFKERLLNCAVSCLSFWINCFRTNAASCRAVCCGLENVSAPVMRHVMPRLSLNVTLPNEQEIATLGKNCPQEFFITSELTDVDEELNSESAVPISHPGSITPTDLDPGSPISQAKSEPVGDPAGDDSRVPSLQSEPFRQS